MSASDLSAAATVQITVSNSGSAAGEPVPVTFLVGNPKPELAAISPMAVTAGYAVSLTATGSYLVAGEQILWNGNPLSTTAVNSTTLTAQVPASDLAAAATVSVIRFESRTGRRPIDVKSDPDDSRSLHLFSSGHSLLADGGELMW